MERKRKKRQRKKNEERKRCNVWERKEYERLKLKYKSHNCNDYPKNYGFCTKCLDELVFKEV